MSDFIDQNLAEKRFLIEENREWWEKRDREDKDGIRETTESVIGPEGGWLVLEDCYVRLPPGAVDDVKYFCMDLHGDSSRTCPDGCIGISPKLVCRPEMRFACPVEVRLPSWCSVKANDGDDVIAHIACMNEDGIELIANVSLKNAKGEIIFKTDRLATFWAHINSFAYNAVKLNLHPQLFHHPDGTFSTVFTNKGAISKEICSRMTKVDHIIGPLPLDEMIVKEGDEITVSMRAESLEDDDIFSFEQPRISLQIDEEYVTCPQSTLRHQIKPRPKPGQFIQYEYVIAHNGKETRKEFILTWPGKAQPEEDPEPEKVPEPTVHSIMDEED